MKNKILCLHGFKQFDMYFMNETNKIKQFFNDDCQFYYFSAPVMIPNKKRARGWWRFDKKKQIYCGIHYSLIYIMKLFDKYQFDGIMGFSQGSILAMIICLFQERPQLLREFFSLNMDTYNNDIQISNDVDIDINNIDYDNLCFPKIKFCWLFSGFIPNDIHLRKYFLDIFKRKNERINIPAMIVMARNDIMPIDSVNIIKKLYNKSEIMIHNSGHICCDKPKSLAFYSEFLNKHLYIHSKL